MFCSNCGCQIHNSDRFCENCGAPVYRPGNMGNSGITNGNIMSQMAGNMTRNGMLQAAGQTAAAACGIGRKAKYAAIIGILLAGIVAFVNTYVSGPEDTLEAFCSAFNEGNMNEMLDCLDETSEKTIRGTMDITMGVVDGALGIAGLGGLGIDGDTMIDMMPGLWALSGMGTEMPELELADVEVRYEGNEFLDFLESINLDFDSFYKVFAKKAEVEAVLEMDDETETIVIEMENENFGKWKMNLSDWLRENM